MSCCGINHIAHLNNELSLSFVCLISKRYYTNNNFDNNKYIFYNSITIQHSGKETPAVDSENLPTAAKLTATEPLGRMRKVGGLGDVREKDDTVVEVVNKIKPILEERTGKKYSSLEVIHYKTQVVAGTNYFVKVSQSR